MFDISTKLQVSVVNLIGISSVSNQLLHSIDCISLEFEFKDIRFNGMNHNELLILF